MSKPYVNIGANYLQLLEHLITLLFMRSPSERQDQLEPPSYRELKLLSEVDNDPLATQRQLSRRVGIALGLTNVLLRNLVQKGYVRATKAGWKRWLYGLTPDGFSYKIRLTVAYIHRVLNHYQNVRLALREQLEPLALNSESRVAIYGTGEMAELVYLALREIGIEEIEIFGPEPPNGSKFLGMPVVDVTTLKAQDYDRVVIADLSDMKPLRAQMLELNVAPDKLVALFEVHHGEEGV